MRAAVVSAACVALAVSGCARLGYDGGRAGDVGADASVDGARHDGVADSHDGDIAGSGTVDGDLSPPPPLDGSIDSGVFPGLSVGKLSSLWVLPHSVRLSWTCSGTVPNSAHFELCVGRDATELATAPRCITPEGDGRLGLKQCGAGAALDTTVYDLAASAAFVAEVRVVEPQGGRLQRYTPIVLKTTAEGTVSTYLFREAESAGTPTDGTTTTQVGAYAGTLALRHEYLAGARSTLGLSGFSVSTLGAASFANAYVELFVETTAAAGVFMVLVTQGGEYVYQRAPLDGATGYQRIEAPLAKFRHDVSSVPLDAAAFASATTLRIGAVWTSGGVILADEVRFVW